MRIGLIDIRYLRGPESGAQWKSEEDSGSQGIVFDGMDEATLDETARMLWTRAVKRAMFAVGSSGLTYGLMRQWRKQGLIGAMPSVETAAPADRLLVLSGSCSPSTARQIRHAKQHGFAAWKLEHGQDWAAAARRALAALNAGRSVVIYTALGPANAGAPYGEEFGKALGRWLRELLQASGVRRVVIAGGDTATHAVQQLKISALTFAAPLVPGVPLCRCHAPGSALHGLELALKGGQMGRDDFFSQVRAGGLV